MKRIPGKVIIITIFFFLRVSKCAMQNEGYRWWMLWEFTVGKLRQAFTGAGICAKAQTEQHAKLGTGIPFAFLIFIRHFASKDIPFPRRF